MAGEVDLPAVGRVNKTWVYAGGAAVAAVVAVAWWRRRSAAPAGPTTDPTTGTDSHDPVYRNPAPGFTSDPNTAHLPPTSDQEWTARVLDKMSWMEPGFLGDVLGKYLSRQPVSLAEAAVIRTAWALEGKPPGNQPIILATDTSTPGGGGGGATPLPVSGRPTVLLTVREGNHVDEVLTNHRMSLADLFALNPGLGLADGDDQGYISSKNPPGPGPVRKLFGSTQTIKVYAK